MFGMDKDKAADPNGLIMEFLRTVEEVIKGNHLEIFAEFHKNLVIEESMKSNIIILVSKKYLSIKGQDSHLISLVPTIPCILFA